MKNITMQRYFSMLAVAIIIALVAVVFFTRSNKAVTGIKQVNKIGDVHYETRIP